MGNLIWSVSIIIDDRKQYTYKILLHNKLYKTYIVMLYN